MRQKKASLLVSSFIIILVLILIASSILYLFSFFDFGKSQKELVIKNAKAEVSNNLFLIGLLRQQMPNDNIMFSDFLMMHKDDKAKIDTFMEDRLRQLYSKDVCFRLTIDDQIVAEKRSDCQNVLDPIDAEIFMPGIPDKIYSIELDIR